MTFHIHLRVAHRQHYLPLGHPIARLDHDLLNNAIAGRIDTSEQFGFQHTVEALAGAEWRGPDGPDSFYDKTGAELPASEAGRWTQYRAILDTANCAASPVLTAVEIAARTAKIGGSFVGKIFQGAEFEAGREALRKHFAKVRVLKPGEAYYFDSRTPHRFRNVGEVDALIVSASTPPTF